MTSPAKTEEGYKKRVRTMKIGARLAQAAGKKQPSWWERPLANMMRKMMTPNPKHDEFLRDEICDADIEFSPDELREWSGRPAAQSED